MPDKLVLAEAGKHSGMTSSEHTLTFQPNLFANFAPWRLRD